MIIEEIPARVYFDLAETSNPLRANEVLKGKLNGVFLKYCETLGVDEREFGIRSNRVPAFPNVGRSVTLL